VVIEPIALLTAHRAALVSFIGDRLPTRGAALRSKVIIAFYDQIIGALRAAQRA
jgi:hypothetical protein